MTNADDSLRRKQRTDSNPFAESLVGGGDLRNQQAGPSWTTKARTAFPNGS